MVLEGFSAADRNATTQPNSAAASQDTLLPLAASSDSSLASLIASWASTLTSPTFAATSSLDDAVATAFHARDLALPKRVAVPILKGDIPKTVAERLLALDTQQLPAASLLGGEGAAGKKHAKSPVAFIFSGQGGNWAGMGLSFAQHFPLFAQTVQELDGLFVSITGGKVSPWKEMQSRDAETSRLQSTVIGQACLFTWQVAMARVAEAACGLAPQAVIGHSLGEIGAAVFAGALTPAEGVRLIVERSALQEAAEGRGRMLALTLSVEEAKELVGATGLETVDIAVVNAPRSVVLAGSEADLERVLSQAEATTSASCRYLKVPCAYHSRMMEGFDRKLQATMTAHLNPQTCRNGMQFYSTVAGSIVAGEQLDAEYWGRNLRQTVRFAEAVDSASGDGMAVFLEISPHPLLADRKSVV